MSSPEGWWLYNLRRCKGTKISQEESREEVLLTDDEMCAWWAAEGSTPIGDASGHFVYVTQDDLSFVRQFAKAVRARGFRFRVIIVKKGSYALRADAASAFKFIMDIILPRKVRIPTKRHKQAKEYADRLSRTMGRGLGRDLRGKLR